MVTLEALTPVHVAIGCLGLTAILAWVDAIFKSKKPDLIAAATDFNHAVLSRCPTLKDVYTCTPFLTNGHVETIVVAKLRKPPGVEYRREIILTKDGGAVAIDWEHVGDDGKDLPADAPVLILFPGLTGGSCDSYVQHAVLQARHAGIRAAVFNSRGTADSPVITPQFYSASFTDDTREVVAHVRKSYPDSTLFAAGWSLGANIMVNYLGEQGCDTPIEAAVSMCNPFDLTVSNKQINEGFNKIYNWNLAASLKRIFMKHELVWKGHSGPAQPQLVPTCTTIREFDEAITVHSFAWQDVDAYYAGSSSAKRIPAVEIPLLCIQALDDPIAPAEAIPCDEIAANPNCVLAVTPTGGHLGWAAGPGAPFGEPWTDAAVFEWLSSVHIELMKQKGRSSSGSSNSSSNGAGGAGQKAAAGAEKVAAGVSSKQPLQVSVTASSERVAVSAAAHSNSSGRTMRSVADANSSDQTFSTAGYAESCGSCTSNTTQQQQGLEVQVEPARVMEQMWWGEAKPQSPPPPQQQQQQRQQVKRGPSSSRITSACSSPEPAAAVLAAAASAGPDAPLQVGQQVAAVSAGTAVDNEQQQQQQQLLASAVQGTDGSDTSQPEQEQPSQQHEELAAQIFTTQLRWAF